MEEIFNQGAFATRVEGDEELMRELLEIFLEQAPQQITEMHLAVKSQDAGRLQGQAHSLKGAAASISAEALKEVASLLEQVGKSQNLTQATTLLVQLGEQFEALEKVLDDYLHSP